MLEKLKTNRFEQRNLQLTSQRLRPVKIYKNFAYTAGDDTLIYKVDLSSMEFKDFVVFTILGIAPYLPSELNTPLMIFLRHYVHQ